MGRQKKATDDLRLLAAALRSSGPLLRMELLVASRRRRTYWLRVGYVLSLTLVTALVWVAVTADVGEGGGFTRARMAEAGKMVVGDVLTFLWVAGPVAAVLLMSNCFADELYHGSLWSLMSTPLGFSQIVVGKFLSRCVQLSVVLIGVLPALAMARVFGGVPWSLVLAGVAVILSTSAFAGALAMLYSTRYRRPYKTIARAVAIGLLASLPAKGWLSWACQEMAEGRSGVVVHFWPVVSGLSLLLTAAALLLCIDAFSRCGRAVLGNASPDGLKFHRDRPVTLPMAAGAAVRGRPVAGEVAAAAAALEAADSETARAPGRRTPWPLAIPGSPIVWRAMRKSFLLEPGTTCIVVGGVLLHLYIFGSFCGAMAQPWFHMAISVGSLLLYAGFLAVLAAGSISSEKESRCWPLLLTTPLTDGQILWAKARAVLWRASPPLMVLGVHVGLFMTAGLIPPIAVLHVAMILAGMTVFLLGLGLHASVRCRRTTTATMVVVGVAAALWLVLPWLAGLIQRVVAALWGGHGQWVARAGGLGLMHQVAAAVQGAMGAEGGAWDYLGGPPHSYSWCGADLTTAQFTLVMLWYMTWHVLAGMLLGWLGKRRFRRDAGAAGRAGGG